MYIYSYNNSYECICITIDLLSSTGVVVFAYTIKLYCPWTSSTTQTKTTTPLAIAVHMEMHFHQSGNIYYPKKNYFRRTWFLFITRNLSVFGFTPVPMEFITFSVVGRPSPFTRIVSVSKFAFRHIQKEGKLMLQINNDGRKGWRLCTY